MFWEVIKTCLSPVTFAAAIRLSCPLLIGSMGGCFNEKTSTGNLSYECFMLTGAFFGAYGSYLSGSPLFGSFMAMASGAALAALYGLLVFHFNCRAMIVSIAYNNAAWAFTTLLLTTVWGVRGNFTDPSIVGYRPLGWEALKKIPLLDTLFNNNIGMVYFAYFYVFLAFIVMYKTPFGLRLRGVGINPAAAETAGISVRKYRWICLFIMGLSMGLAGSYMPLSGLSMFTENMTRGRGFLCLTAILVGKGDPWKTALVAALFAYTSSMTLVLSSYGLPTQIMNMTPYVVVLIVLLMTGWRRFKGNADISGDTV
ncbi:MAG: ABC transporter permease [Spirochaetaceae bacterium]|jgi:simple sugar transport system permease protein|nr:ABC transporter permease [Spirochaetaceae bacterium]